ncbi:hypothetical protein A5810_003163, partial [Enterococcus faecium]
MDLIDKAKDFASDAGEKIGDTFSGIFEGV